MKIIPKTGSMMAITKNGRKQFPIIFETNTQSVGIFGISSRLQPIQLKNRVSIVAQTYAQLFFSISYFSLSLWWVIGQNDTAGFSEGILPSPSGIFRFTRFLFIFYGDYPITTCSLFLAASRSPESRRLEPVIILGLS